MYLAPLAEYPPKLLPSLSYNGLYNVLDFPVGSVPVDNFTKQDEVSIPSKLKAHSFSSEFRLQIANFSSY